MKENVVLNGIEIDMEAICSITHECNPELCKESICCCSCYEICIDNNEIDTITDWLPEAVKFSPHLNSGSDFDNVFDQIKPNQYAIDTAENGLCVFAYNSPDKKTFCSLHSAALKHDIPPYKIKPKSSRPANKPIFHHASPPRV